MITAIINDFRRATTFSTNDEVALFRELAIAIVKHSKSTFIDETHGGNVCNVTFHDVLGAPTTCEIADLLILSGSHKSGLRATFWQAKKQATSKWVSATLCDTQLDFRGQLNQWDLLSRRPAISGVGTFHPPKDLLSSFASPSIGSFGIFYERTRTIEVAHSVAEFIACPSPVPKHPTLSINGNLEKYSFYGHEVIAKMSLMPFLDALLHFRIGAQLDPSHISHQWLVRYVRSRVPQKTAPSAVLSLLDNFLGSGINDNDRKDGPSSDGLSVLIVADSEAG